jgi:mannose-6-phosphate isomerase-like protein (cupin superfamily)
VVVKGKAKVTIGNNIKIIPEGNSVYIPKTEKHRLENPNTEPILLVEVQIGSYLGEDDIIRYEDIYSRK